MKNNGLTKEDLKEKLDLSSNDVDHIIRHLEEKGVIEIKDGNLYANKDAIRKIKNN